MSDPDLDPDPPIPFLSNPSSASALTVEPIASERLLFVVAKERPLAKKPIFNTDELADLPLLVGTGNDGNSPAVDVIKRSVPAKCKDEIRQSWPNLPAGNDPCDENRVL